MKLLPVCVGIAFFDDKIQMKDKLLKLIEHKGEIPPLPDILFRLSSKVDDPNCELSEIAGLIETEPVLSGKLTKMANSVFYGSGREASKDLSTSIMRLGLKMVLDLAYSLELPKMFYKSKGFDQKQFWRHSLAVGILSRAIGQKVIPHKKEQEKCYLSGLMHDIGILVFYYLIPKEYAEFLSEITDVEKTLEVLEEKAFGISHPDLGAAFVQKWWPIEPDVVQAINHHHRLGQDIIKEPLFSRVVMVANQIMNNIGITNGTLAYFKPIHKQSLKDWGLTTEDMTIMLQETRKNLDATESILNF